MNYKLLIQLTILATAISIAAATVVYSAAYVACSLVPTCNVEEQL